MEALDRKIVAVLHGGFPISVRPYAEVAEALGIEEADLLRRLGRLLEQGILSRFGPLYDAERLGGAVTLAAMVVPPERFDEVAALVNAHREVAHNYARDHVLNMWFVLATEAPERIPKVIEEIESEAGLAVYNFPRRREFYVGLRLVP